MIIADTSIWVQHFRLGLAALAKELEQGFISMPAVVLGELAVGNLARRRQTLSALCSLPRTTMGTATECLHFLETHRLYGRGIVWNDVQLLVAARLSGNSLWTLDERLSAAATDLGVAHREQ